MPTYTHMRWQALVGETLLCTLKFCGVMMAVLILGQEMSKLVIMTLGEEGVWGLDANCHQGLGLGLEVQFWAWKLWIKYNNPVIILN